MKSLIDKYTKEIEWREGRKSQAMHMGKNNEIAINAEIEVYKEVLNDLNGLEIQKNNITLLQKIKYFFMGTPIVSAEYKDGVMKVVWEDGSSAAYKGSCTVWHKMPYMRRCGTATEGWLCDLWKYNKQWDGAYPNAHKNK